MDFDYLVIGAGISGASAGYELALQGRTLMVDMEPSPGFHSTGRSAALYTPNYGPELVRQINKLSYPFLASPPAGFSANPLLTPRGMLTVICSADAHVLPSLLHKGADYLEQLDSTQTLQHAPFLLANNICGSLYEKGVFDMDVNALHQGFLTGFKQRNGTLICSAKVEALERKSNAWQVSVKGASYIVGMVVNAAGAWADEVGALAGATTIGLQPRRRTAILVEPPANTLLASVPAIDFHGTDNYIKPEAQQLMVSPGDETLVDAQDIQPDDLDVAKLVDWLERTTVVKVNRVAHQWAGLRNFTAYGTPVVGFDPSVNGFFWLAAQGGYGIMMSSALGRAAASMITHTCLPDDFIQAGVNPAALGVQ